MVTRFWFTIFARLFIPLSIFWRWISMVIFSPLLSIAFPPKAMTMCSFSAVERCRAAWNITIGVWCRMRWEAKVRVVDNILVHWIARASSFYEIEQRHFSQSGCAWCGVWVLFWSSCHGRLSTNDKGRHQLRQADSFVARQKNDTHREGIVIDLMLWFASEGSGSVVLRRIGMP